MPRQALMSTAQEQDAASAEGREQSASQEQALRRGAAEDKIHALWKDIDERLDLRLPGYTSI